MANPTPKGIIVEEDQTLPQPLGEVDEGGGIINALSRNVAQPFNKGLLDLVPIQPLRQAAERGGFVAPRGEEATGIMPRIMEILAGGALVGGPIAGAGRKLLGEGLRVAAPTIAEKIAMDTARAPVSTAVGELLGSAGAGVGGEVAGPGNELAGELIGGTAAVMAPAAAIALPSARIAGKAGEALRSLSPTARASHELQSRAVDPDTSAARIDPSSPMPPARQAGDERLLALERDLLEKGDPAQAERTRRHVQQTAADAEAAATDIGGDPEAARAVIAAQGEATVERATRRADTALQEAERALADIDPGVAPSEISREARAKLNAAQDAAQAAEREAWSKVGFDSPGDYQNTRAKLEEIVQKVGRPNRNEAIPDFVLRELNADEAADAVTMLRDIHALRSRVQDAKRAAQVDPDRRFQVKWLGELEESLLADMNAVQSANPEALGRARAATAEFYQKFRRGKVGKVLGLAEPGQPRVVDEDTLTNVLAGREPARDLQQLFASAPGTETDAADFIRKQFLMSTVTDGSVNQRQANSYIKALEKKRIFEVMPELRGQLEAATSASQRAQLLAERAAIVKERGGARLEQDSKKSLASLYLDQPVGEEAKILLAGGKTRNPEQLARRLRARLDGNEAAEQGLRRSFAEALMDSAKGTKIDAEGRPVVSGARYTALLRDNMGTLQALGFDDGQIQRMRQTAKILREAEARATGPSGAIMTDPMGRLMDIVGAYAGARLGSMINRAMGGKGAGVSLQAAQRGASNLSQFAKWITPDAAENLLIQAIDDPDLFRALLLRNNASARELKRARSKINAWAFGAGVDEWGDEPEETTGDAAGKL